MFEKNSWVRWLLRFAAAFAAALALSCPFSVGDSLIEDTAFMSDTASLLVFAVVLCGFGYLPRLRRKTDVGALLLSGVFAVTYVLGQTFCRYNSIVFFTASRAQMMMALLCLVGYWAVFDLVLNYAFALVETYRGRPLVVMPWLEQRTDNQFFVMSAVLIAAAWLPWLVVNYPAVANVDAIYQLRQFLGQEAWSTHHPPLSTLIMGATYTIGHAIGGANLGLFLYPLLQTIAGAIIFGQCVRTLRRLEMPAWGCLCAVLFFALVPLWGSMACWYEKDLLYAEFAALQTLSMVQVLKDGRCSGKQAACLVVTGLLMALLRNNGIYALAPALLLLALVLKGQERRRALLAFAATLVVYFGVTKGLYPALGMKSGSIAEALSIPFQQSARYVCAYGDEVTEEEKEALVAVLDYECLQSYNPRLSDVVKNSYKGDNSKLPAYFKAWFGMLKKHPDVYFSAFVNGSYGYIAPVNPVWEADFEAGETNEYWASLGVFHPIDPELPTRFRVWGGEWVYMPVVGLLHAPGLYTWLVLVCGVLLLKHRKGRAMVLLVPAAVNMLVCMASPMASSARYALPTIAVVPLLLGWTVYHVRNRTNR